MKRFVKICAVTGLILLLLGLGITAVSAAMGGRYTNSLPSRLASRVCHNHMPWLVRRGNDWQDDRIIGTAGMTRMTQTAPVALRR